MTSFAQAGREMRVSDVPNIMRALNSGFIFVAGCRGYLYIVRFDPSIRRLAMKFSKNMYHQIKSVCELDNTRVAFTIADSIGNVHVFDLVQMRVTQSIPVSEGKIEKVWKDFRFDYETWPICYVLHTNK